MSDNMPTKGQLYHALKRWWESFRPVDWKEKEHIENPTINCQESEKELARMVARMRLRAITFKKSKP